MNSTKKRIRPDKKGQIVKFHSPLPDEDADQLYVILEAFEDLDRPRASIKPLSTGINFPPIITVALNELEIAEVDMSDLYGQRATVKKSEGSYVNGIVTDVKNAHFQPDLKKTDNGVETDVIITVKDDSGKKHTGPLFVEK